MRNEREPGREGLSVREWEIKPEIVRAVRNGNGGECTSEEACGRLENVSIRTETEPEHPREQES